MKYIPITVRVPGSGGDELSLTPSEARMLVQRLEKRLTEYDAIKARFGVSAARKSNKRPYQKILRGQMPSDLPRMPSDLPSPSPADRTEGQES